jgi:hypothetical protein
MGRALSTVVQMLVCERRAVGTAVAASIEVTVKHMDGVGTA